MWKHIFLTRIIAIIIFIPCVTSYSISKHRNFSVKANKNQVISSYNDELIGAIAGLNNKSKNFQNSPILILKNASFWRKDRQILSNINLNINPGERIGIIGNNGAGKSTLIKLIYSCVTNSPASDALITCDETIYRGSKVIKAKQVVDSDQFYYILGLWLSIRLSNAKTDSPKQFIETCIDKMEEFGFEEFYKTIIGKIGNTLSKNICTLADTNGIVYMHQDFKSELKMSNILVAEIARFLQPIFLKDRFSKFISDRIYELEDIVDSCKDMGVIDHVKNLLNTYNQNSTVINRQFVECRNKADKLLKIFELDHYKDIELGNLSSGLIVRSYILLSMLQNPDLMLLDEPTNNLDVKNSAFLAEALKEAVNKYKTSVVAVSHDEIFLNKYSNIIWECPGDGSVQVVKGNYERFIQYKNDRIKHVQLRNSRLATLITKLSSKKVESAVERGDKSVKAESKRFSEKIDRYKKEMEELRVTRGPLEVSKYSKLYVKSLKTGEDEDLFNEKRFKSLHNNLLFFKGSPCKFVDGNLLEFRNYSISKSFVAEPSDYIIRDYSFNVKSCANIAIMGKNGIGKSILIKSILGTLSDKFTISGDLKLAKGNIKINYFPQLPITLFNTNTSVWQLLLDIVNNVTSVQGSLYHSLEGYDYGTNKIDDAEGYLKQIMANFHIDDVIAKSFIGKCSSGEKSRITLSLMFMRDCNLMILDEPTNHLDTFLKSYLAFLLNNIFCGKFIIISHDQMFLEKLAIDNVLYLYDSNTIYSISNGREFIKDFYSSVHDDNFDLQKFLDSRGSKTVDKSEIKIYSSGERVADVLERQEMEMEEEKARDAKRRASFGGNNISGAARIKNSNRWK